MCRFTISSHLPSSLMIFNVLITGSSFAEDVCDIIGILNEGQLITVGSPYEIIETVGTRNLEDAYLGIVGGQVDKTELLAWRQ